MLVECYHLIAVFCLICLDWVLPPWQASKYFHRWFLPIISLLTIHFYLLEFWLSDLYFCWSCDLLMVSFFLKCVNLFNLIFGGLRSPKQLFLLEVIHTVLILRRQWGRPRHSSKLTAVPAKKFHSISAYHLSKFSLFLRFRFSFNCYLLVPYLSRTYWAQGQPTFQLVKRLNLSPYYRFSDPSYLIFLFFHRFL